MPTNEEGSIGVYQDTDGSWHVEVSQGENVRRVGPFLDAFAAKKFMDTLVLVLGAFGVQSEKLYDHITDPPDKRLMN